MRWKKCIFSASVYIGKFHNLIQIYNKYEGIKYLTFFFW